MPALRHASMSSVPAGAVSFFPSTVNVTSAIRLQRPLHYGDFSVFRERTGLAVQVLFKLFAKLLHKAKGWHGRGVAERAESSAHHVVSQILDVVYVLGSAEACVESCQRLLQPVRSLA